MPFDLQPRAFINQKEGIVLLHSILSLNSIMIIPNTFYAMDNPSDLRYEITEQYANELV